MRPRRDDTTASATTILVHAAGAGMMSRGKLEYTGFAQPNDWPAPSLAALPVSQELLVVSDLQRDPRCAQPCISSHSDLVTV